MTDDQKHQIASDEFKFRLHVIDQLAEQRSRWETTNDAVCGLERTVYGPDGNSGLVASVIRLQGAMTRYNIGLGLLQTLGAIAVGCLAYLGFIKKG